VGDAPEELVEYAYLTSHQPGARYAPFYFLAGRLFTEDARTTLYEPLTVPTLVIYDRDPNVSFEMLSQLTNANSQVRGVRVSPTQGIPQWDKPAETAAVLDDFWTD
jgi:pimeloyl-ACP methyl ester carboxylesterase